MKRKNKAVYVAGPYTGNTLATARHIRRGLALASDLMMQGYTVYAPWTDYMYALHREIPVECYIDNSMEIMERFDCLVLAPGWEFSPGTMKEIHRARELEMPIYLTQRDLRNKRQGSLGYDADNNLHKLIVVAGPPATGKSTWCHYAQEHQKLTPALAAYHSVDDAFPEVVCDDGAVRRYWVDDNGDVRHWGIDPIPRSQIVDAYAGLFADVCKEMQAGAPLIIAEGAFEQQTLREMMLSLADHHGYYAEIKISAEPMQQAVFNNTKRDDSVPQQVIDRIIDHWDPILPGEGWDAFTAFHAEGLEDKTI